MPEWHCDPGVNIAGMTARSISKNLNLYLFNRVTESLKGGKDGYESAY